MKKITLISFLICFFSLIFSTLTIAQPQQEWPVEVNSPHGKILIYQPQPETFKDNKLTGRAAVSVTLNGKKSPAFGAMWFDAVLTTDLDKRTFDLQSVTITRVKFSEINSEEAAEFSLVFGKELPKINFHGSLDTLLTTLESAQKEQQISKNLQTAPPKIIYLKYPAMLVLLDGEPKLQAVDGTKLMRVVNTPMLMVFNPADKKYYLSSGNAWYSTADVMGAWQIDINPPPEIANMITNNGQQVKNTIPDAQMPRIIVATSPTELIISEGEPQFSPIQGTDLLFMSNTENDVFMEINSQSYYVLISGRWYKSPALDGKWEFVAQSELPADFAKIPPGSAKGNVLVSVAETEQAKDALIAAQIPQTAAIERSKASLTVKYDGEPKFVKISGTDMKYAANTETPVLLVNGKYYACDNAVWFVAPTPNGPWVVADSIPSEIHNIPPDSPVYNVKYVYIYNSTPEVVYVGYTAGYLGWYPYYGTVVYGTGFVYPAWYSPYYYYPHPVTFGFAVHYNSYTDSWAFGFRWSNGFVTTGFVWNNWWHSPGWYHPGPNPWYYPGPHHINCLPGMLCSGGGQKMVNINQINIGNNNIHVDQNNVRNIYNNNVNSNRVALTSSAQKNLLNVAKDRENNLITDKDGNVYRRNKDQWEKSDGQKWEQASSSLSSKGITKETAKEQVSQKPVTSKEINKQQAKEQISQKSASGHQVKEKISQRPEVPTQVVQDYHARQRGVERAAKFDSNFGSSVRGSLLKH